MYTFHECDVICLLAERGDCTPHRTDDAFLLRFLRARHFVVERAYRLVNILKEWYIFLYNLHLFTASELLQFQGR